LYIILTIIILYYIPSLFLLFIAVKICSPKDTRRSLKFSSKEKVEYEENFNLSSELNGVFPLSQTSVVSFNLDDNNENEVCYIYSPTQQRSKLYLLYVY